MFSGHSLPPGLGAASAVNEFAEYFSVALEVYSHIVIECGVMEVHDYRGGTFGGDVQRSIVGDGYVVGVSRLYHGHRKRAAQRGGERR